MNFSLNLQEKENYGLSCNLKIRKYGSCKTKTDIKKKVDTVKVLLSNLEDKSFINKEKWF